MSQQIDIAQVYPNPDQPRKFFDPVALQELADSIKEVGLLSPIAVRPNGTGYIIIHGERRWRACQLAGLTTIRTEIVETGENDAYTMSVVENEQREGLSPIETAQSLKKIMDAENLTQSAIARRIGKSRDWVAQKMRLLNLPESAKDAIAGNALTEAHGRQLLKLNSASLGDRITGLAEQATKEQWSVSRLESEVLVSEIRKNVGNEYESYYEAIREAWQQLYIEESKRAIEERQQIAELHRQIDALNEVIINKISDITQKRQALNYLRGDIESMESEVVSYLVKGVQQAEIPSPGDLIDKIESNGGWRQWASELGLNVIDSEELAHAAKQHYRLNFQMSRDDRELIRDWIKEEIEESDDLDLYPDSPDESPEEMIARVLGGSEDE